jgi:hypothetical protein
VALVALVLFIGLVNFAIGFGLAVQLGHGPAWADLLQYVRPKPVARGHGRHASAGKARAR